MYMCFLLVSPHVGYASDGDKSDGNLAHVLRGGVSVIAPVQTSWTSALDLQIHPKNPCIFPFYEYTSMVSYDLPIMSPISHLLVHSIRHPPIPNSTLTLQYIPLLTLVKRHPLHLLLIELVILLF